jgi:hypothetical protein
MRVRIIPSASRVTTQIRVRSSRNALPE